MFNLIRNENVKIYRRVRTYIFMGIVVLATVVTGIVINHMQSTASTDWKPQLQATNQQLIKEQSDAHLPQSARNNLAAQIKVNQYKIDHNMDPNRETAWDFTNSTSGIISLVTIFVAVVAGDILAGEFSAGTIKLLLIRPVNRTKILWSKYLSTLLFALLMVVGLWAVSLILGGFLFGFTGASLPYFWASSDGVIHQSSMFAHVLTTYGISCVTLVMIATISFMISAIFRSSSLAIALSILLMFLGDTATRLLSSFQWDKYILFANTNLTQYFEGQPLVQGMTLTFSIVMLVVYFIIFHVASWLLFTKRDVGA